MAIQSTAVGTAGGPQVPMPGVGGASNGQLVDGGVPVTNPSQPSAGVAGSNTYAAPGSVPTSTVQGTDGINFSGTAANTLGGDFNATYGSAGGAITSVLSGLGTSTDSAITAENAQIQQQAGIQSANISAQEAASGISPNSSTAALAQGDFASQVNTSEQATDSSMELNEEGTLLSALTSEGSAHGGDSSFLGSLGDVLGSAGSGITSLISGGANALNSTAASGTGGFSDILSALGEL